MSNLKKVQTYTKNAEEKSVELNREISMNAKLISKFITQKVAVAMSKKSKEYEKKIKRLEKGGKDRVSGEASQKTVRGAVDTPHRKTSHPRLKQPPSLVLHRNLCLDRHKVERISSEALSKEYHNKQALPAAVRLKKGKRKKECATRAH